MVDEVNFESQYLWRYEIDDYEQYIAEDKMESLVDKLFLVSPDDPSYTFEHDESLPSLPVPSLHHTMSRYIDSVKPFVTKEELAKTLKLVSEFESGIGKKLQAKLVQRARNERNWLEKWWEDVAYLSNRQPLLPFSDMVGLPSPGKFEWETGGFFDQVKNASLFCYYATELWQMLRKQKLRSDQSRDGKQHFSMYGFRRLYNCVRTPGDPQDSLAMYFRTASEGSCPSHVVVLCGGHMYSMNAVTESGDLLTPPEWEQQLTYIKEKSQRRKGPGVPMLSCTDRTTWAKNRRHLESLSVDNRWVFNTIDTALFVLSLDEDAADSVSDVGQQTLSGDLSNRWADKSLGVIFYSNGVHGVLSSHTAFDGMVSVLSLNFVHLRLTETGWRWQGSQTVRELAPVQEICMQIDKHIEEELTKAAAMIEVTKPCLLLLREKYTGYGKELIKKFKIHPDHFVQLVLQLAYYRMHGRPAPTYETATTREYYHGRTETVRSCTPETMECVRAILSSKTPDSTKRELLKKAVEKHSKLMEEAKSNAGCDRHLLGLYCAAVEEGEEIPAIFTDPAFTKSGGNGNFILSTSLVGYTPIGGGVAPMCKDGYGVFYNICPDSLDFTITVFRDSWETSSHKYFRSLQQSFDDMKLVMGEMPSSHL